MGSGRGALEEGGERKGGGNDALGNEESKLFYHPYDDHI